MYVVIFSENTEWPVVASKNIERVRLLVPAVVASASDFVVCDFAAHFTGGGLSVDCQLIVCIMRPNFLEIVGPVVAECGWI